MAKFHLLTVTPFHSAGLSAGKVYKSQCLYGFTLPPPPSGGGYPSHLIFILGLADNIYDDDDRLRSGVVFHIPFISTTFEEDTTF